MEKEIDELMQSTVEPEFWIEMVMLAILNKQPDDLSKPERAKILARVVQELCTTCCQGLKPCHCYE